MSVKKYGIYLAYPPTVELRCEGLGRYLVEFLKASLSRQDVCFVIACPSWMKKSLYDLLRSSAVSPDNFEFICPERKPFILIGYEKYVACKARPKKSGWMAAAGRFFRDAAGALRRKIEQRVVAIRSVADLLFVLTVLLPVVPLYLAWIVFKPCCIRFVGALRSLRIRMLNRVQLVLQRLNAVASKPKEDPWVLRMFSGVMAAESALMLKMINKRKDVLAWYCPTAFWPQFNEIKAPRLMCVPDVVLTQFPVGFSAVGGQRFLENFRQVEQAINGGQNFVTYSADVKWKTLVKRYNVSPDVISVIPHGANRLDDLVAVSGCSDNAKAADALCQSLFFSALNKSVRCRSVLLQGEGTVRFIFYASQIRPNKNIITLLRAYKYLCSSRYFGCKLVLTGHPAKMPEVAKFVEDNNLDNDVLFLNGLSERELAACYRLADLAVNPSLSEGGCPFTFTEALSVGTPVVMARIPVSEEIVTDDSLQQQMFFDPYDWKDTAKRIEWGLHNRDELLELQKPFYEKLAKRTWKNVVNEHLDVLDKLSARE